MSAIAVCEVGPVSVRSLRRRADADLSAAALDGADDPLTLVGDRAVAVDALWRDVLEPLLRGADAGVLVHPSWWTSPRVRTMARGAAELDADVETMSRAELVALRHPDPVLVEIAPHRVILTVGGHLVGAQSRDVPTEVVADAVAGRVRGIDTTGTVWLDAPADVPGGRILAAMIGTRLEGTRLRPFDICELAKGVGQSAPELGPPQATGHRRRPALAAAAVLLGATALTVPWRTPDPGPPAMATTDLVEGRVTTQIPADWVTRHVTGGPGSARVEAVAPHDPGLVLHVTQARVPTDDLTASAASLRTALETQPPGVFVDFNPSDHRAGRPAVTYREVRQGHDIRWAVVVDGGVRIGIGCQSPPARERDIGAACEHAVRTARRIP